MAALNSNESESPHHSVSFFSIITISPAPASLVVATLTSLDCGGSILPRNDDSITRDIKDRSSSLLYTAPSIVS